MNSRDPTIKKLLQQNEMLNYRLQKAHQKYQQTIENIAAENSKLRNEVNLIFSLFLRSIMCFSCKIDLRGPGTPEWVWNFHGQIKDFSDKYDEISKSFKCICQTGFQ